MVSFWLTAQCGIYYSSGHELGILKYSDIGIENRTYWCGCNAVHQSFRIRLDGGS